MKKVIFQALALALALALGAAPGERRPRPSGW